MDDSLPDMNGMTAIRHVKAQSNPPYLILLSMWDVDEYRTVALAAGADEFVSKVGCEKTLVPLIEALGATPAENAMKL
jgi:DNA-binding NarL/FixJ family response regulator